MKIATWNVNSLRVRLPHLLEWLGQAAPDLVGLQETKLQDPDFPQSALVAAGYQVAYAGQKSYNGVALLSRQPMSDVVTDLVGLDDPQRRVLAATVGGARIYNLYVPNGQEVGSEKYAYKLTWLEHLRQQLARDLAKYSDAVVMGDFNIAPEDRDVHDPASWAGKILCSEDERRALGDLLDLGFVDTFRLFPQPEGIFSWWDYRAAGFRRNLGLRIDLILASNGLASRCAGSTIDRAPRSLERPSDHAPAVAIFDD